MVGEAICGFELPAPVVISGEESDAIVIVFESDFSHAYQGFAINVVIGSTDAPATEVGENILCFVYWFLCEHCYF